MNKQQCAVCKKRFTKGETHMSQLLGVQCGFCGCFYKRRWNYGWNFSLLGEMYCPNPNCRSNQQKELKNVCKHCEERH